MGEAYGASSRIASGCCSSSSPTPPAPIPRCARSCAAATAELWRDVAAALGCARPQAVQGFFAIGMLLTVGATIGVPELMDDAQWARDLLAKRVAPGETYDPTSSTHASRQARSHSSSSGERGKELEAHEPAAERLRLQACDPALDHARGADDAELEAEDVIRGRRPAPADGADAVRRGVEQDELDRLARGVHARDRLGRHGRAAGGKPQRPPSACGAVLAERTHRDLTGPARTARELDVDLPRAGVGREPAQRERGARVRQHLELAEQERGLERVHDRGVQRRAALGSELDGRADRPAWRGVRYLASSGRLSVIRAGNVEGRVPAARGRLPSPRA